MSSNQLHQKSISIFLKEELLRRKSRNENYSLRAFSKAIGLSSSFVSKVIHGKKNISLETLLSISSRLNLQETTFEELAEHVSGKVKKTDSDKIPFEEINMDHFHFISDWHYYALLELMTVANFSSSLKWISEKLNISEDKVTQAMDRMHRLGFIEKDKNGAFISKNKKFTNVGQKMPGSAHTEHERQLLHKAIEALDQFDVSQRSQSSMTMAIPESRLEEAREKIKFFQREMNSFLQRKGKRDSVYHLSISFFPLTVKEKNEL